MSSTITTALDESFRNMRDALMSVGSAPVPDQIMEPIAPPDAPIQPGPPVKAAGIMFMEPGGAVLMLRRGAGSDYPGMWCFPGGYVEEGETTEQAAEREAIEEIGFLPKGTRITLSRQIMNGVDYTTFMQAVDKKFMPEVNGEHTGFMWIDPKQIEMIPSD